MAKVSNENDKHVEFVEILFALAASQVAIYAADLVSIDSSREEKLPAAAHLLVGFMVIAASWFEWSPGRTSEGLFSLSFLRTMVDVLLVVLYFIIVSTVEIETSVINTKANVVEPKLQAASARPEAGWLCVVFIVYAFWDFIYDVLPGTGIPEGSSHARFWKRARLLPVVVLASGISFGLVYIVYLVASIKGLSSTSILFLDAALISAVFGFRLLKHLEGPLAQLFRVRDCRAIKKRPSRIADKVFAFLLPVCYVLCVLGALRFQ